MGNKKMLGNLLLLLTAMIWGTAFVGQRVGMDDVGPITFNAARMALAAVAVSLFSFALRQRKTKKDTQTEKEARVCQWRWHTLTGGICCGIFLTAGSVLQQMGLVYTTAGKAGFITSMYMLLVPLLNFFLLKKKNTWAVWLAVLIGMTGMYLLCVTEDLSFTQGDILVCFCALMFSGHILCCDYFVKLADPIELAATQFTAAAIISATVAVIIETPVWAGIVSATIPIVYCGLVSGGIGYTLQIVAQKFTDPAIASLLMSMEAVFAVLAGTILLGEQMTSRELAGCVIMFLAILLVQIPLPAAKKA